MMRYITEKIPIQIGAKACTHSLTGHSLLIENLLRALGKADVQNFLAVQGDSMIYKNSSYSFNNAFIFYVTGTQIIALERHFFRALFTKFLTLGLTHKLCNPLDDWFD